MGADEVRAAPVDAATDANGTPEVPGLREQVLAGSLRMVAMRWSVRALTVIRTVVLARLLSPADFGTAAMGLLLVPLAEFATSFGIDLAVIQHPRSSRALLDTAWTLTIMQRLAATALLLAGAPLAAAYFHDPRVETLIQVLALGVAVSGWENIGIVTVRKSLAFGRDALLEAVKQALIVGTAVIAALLLRSYWALVIAFVVDRSLWTVLSYVLHPYRPRFSVAAWHELAAFSRWVPVTNLGTFVKDRADSFIVGHFAGSAPLGLYEMSGRGAALASDELAWPLGRVLYPTYARLATDAARFATAFVSALGGVATLLLPAAVGTALVAEPLVQVVLGPQWLAAIPVVRCLSGYFAVSTIAGTAWQALLALGRVGRVTAWVWTYTLVYIIVLLFVGRGGDLWAVALAKGAVELTFAPVLFAALCASAPITAAAILRALVRPVAATLIMAGMLLWLGDLAGDSPALALGVKVAIGATTYGVAVCALWILSGRPDGPERIGLTAARRALPATSPR